MSYLVCIDLGTSVCKSIIYDREFNVKGRGYEEVLTYFPRPRWAEQKPEEWWMASCAVIRESLCAAGIRPEDVAGVGVCGQGHGPVLLDARRRALFPCIIWPDLRAIKQAESIMDKLHRDVAAYYTAAKMLWIRENHPETFDKMYKFVLPKDYIRMRLTDIVLTDTGDAAGTMMYSRDEGSWDYQLVDLIGIPREKLPDVLSSDDVVGGVTQMASAETGLRTATQVIAGTADYLCTGLALGDYLQFQRAVVYLGSAPSIFTTGKNGQPKGGFMGIGGASLKWLKERLCCLDAPAFAYETLDKEAEMIEPGSDGVLFLPHMMGERCPVYNPYAQGTIFGLSLGHNRHTIVRSMMEGVAFQLKMIFNNIKETERLDEILVVGGGAKSPVWTQVIADVFNVDVCVPHVEEVGTLGLAVLLSTGLGIYDTVPEAQEKANPKIIKRIAPREAYRQKYDEMFDLYCDLEEALMKFYR
jgi:xylulokinase